MHKGPHAPEPAVPARAGEQKAATTLLLFNTTHKSDSEAQQSQEAILSKVTTIAHTGCFFVSHPLSVREAAKARLQGARGRRGASGTPSRTRVQYLTCGHTQNLGGLRGSGTRRVRAARSAIRESGGDFARPDRVS
jgi:hypothetical protein